MGDWISTTSTTEKSRYAPVIQKKKKKKKKPFSDIQKQNHGIGSRLFGYPVDKGKRTFCCLNM
jgi:hypothetical protein